MSELNLITKRKKLGDHARSRSGSLLRQEVIGVGGGGSGEDNATAPPVDDGAVNGIGRVEEEDPDADVDLEEDNEDVDTDGDGDGEGSLGLDEDMLARELEAELG